MYYKSMKYILFLICFSITINGQLLGANAGNPPPGNIGMPGNTQTGNSGGFSTGVNPALAFVIPLAVDATVKLAIWGGKNGCHYGKKGITKLYNYFVEKKNKN